MDVKRQHGTAFKLLLIEGDLGKAPGLLVQG